MLHREAGLGSFSLGAMSRHRRKYGSCMIKSLTWYLIDGVRNQTRNALVSKEVRKSSRKAWRNLQRRERDLPNRILSGKAEHVLCLVQVDQLLHLQDDTVHVTDVLAVDKDKCAGRVEAGSNDVARIVPGVLLALVEC